MSKVIIITGASSGIGFASLKELAGQGHTVYGSGRKATDRQEIKKAGGKPIEIEMTDESSIKKAVEKVISEQGRVDVLFNNAGYGLYGSVEEVPLKEARHQFEVNLFGLAFLTQQVIPHMRRQKSGTIINTSSMGGKMYTPYGAWYHSTKHALEGWSDCLRLELSQFGIKVVIVEPGLIRTQWGGLMKQNLDKYSSKGPYKEQVKKMGNSYNSSVKPGSGSPPEVIARLVSKAVNSKRPKTRYSGGRYAKILIFTRVFLGDRVYDRLIVSMIE